MTMHLAQGLSTINTKKRKKKALTQKDIERYTIEWRKHNKLMRQKHMHDMQYKSLDDYIAYCRGEKKFTTTFSSLKPEKKYQRETPKYKSLMEEAVKDGTFCKMGTDCTRRKEPQKYTGTLIKGIATMHKSNAVPVIDDQHAKDIARMRR